MDGMMNNTYNLKELTFEITRECPMSCLLCSSNGGTPCDKELSLEKIKNIIDESIEIGTNHINISGGEPLIHPYIGEICLYIKNKGLTVDVYTCGNIISKEGKVTPISSKLLSSLKESSIDKLVFSIHGKNAEIHDKMTAKKGSYINLLESIKRSTQIGISTELHFVATKINYKSLPELMDLFKTLKVDKLSILRFVPQGRGRINKDMLDLNNEEIHELRQILLKLRKKHPHSILRIGSPFNCFHLSNPTFCSAGIDKATIKADTSVVPCVSMKDFQTAKYDNDLYNNSLSEIWNNSQLFEKIRNAYIKIQNSNCNNCIYFNDCKGGCLTQRYLNNIEERDPYCLMHISSAKKTEEEKQCAFSYC